MENENLKYYEMGRAVPTTAQKSFDNGTFKGTDINPMWRIKKLTEMFGACGIGWYYEVMSERAEEHHDITMAIVDLNLYVKVDGEWSKPIYGTGGNKLVQATKNGQKASDEGYKMALTDALSVACKALGIGADIYWDKDKTKYTEFSDSPAAEKASQDAPVAKKEQKPANDTPKQETEQKTASAAQMDAQFFNRFYQGITKLTEGTLFTAQILREEAQKQYGVNSLEQMSTSQALDFYNYIKEKITIQKGEQS